VEDFAPPRVSEREGSHLWKSTEKMRYIRR